MPPSFLFLQFIITMAADLCDGGRTVADHRDLYHYPSGSHGCKSLPAGICPLYAAKMFNYVKCGRCFKKRRRHENVPLFGHQRRVDHRCSAGFSGSACMASSDLSGIRSGTF